MFIFIFEITYAFTLGPICWIYNTDINTNEEALALSVASNWLWAFIVGLISPIIIKVFGS